MISKEEISIRNKYKCRLPVGKSSQGGGGDEGFVCWMVVGGIETTSWKRLLFLVRFFSTGFDIVLNDVDSFLFVVCVLT